MIIKPNSILVICPAYPPPHIGGSKVWVYNMVEHCPENCDVLTSAFKDENTVEVNSPRHRVYRSKYLWDSNLRDPRAIDLLISYCYIIYWLLTKGRKNKYKVIIAGAFDFANGWIILIGKFILGIPIICLGLAEEYTLTLHGRGIKKNIKRFWLKWTHKRANGFIVVCHFCRDVLISIGIKSELISIVPPAITLSKSNQSIVVKKESHSILSVGRIVERKGFHLLIEAVKKLKLEIPNIKLHIVGSGPFSSTIQSLIKKYRMESKVFIHGTVDDNMLSKLYKETNLFVLAHFMLPNGDTEGCPTVFSEASGHGLPVIGGKEGGSSTVIINGITGYIVDSKNVEELAECIKKILLNPDLAKKMGIAGIEKIRSEHTPEVIGLAFYKAIINIVTNLQNKKQTAVS